LCLQLKAVGAEKSERMFSRASQAPAID
jgi:hypothetical protein